MNSIKSRKILIIEDEQELAKMIEGFLKKDGYQLVETASSCQEALKSILSYQPHLIILDVMLPDGDGYELLARLRRNSSVPVIFLTAKGEDQDRLLGLSLGADDYIVKPFLPKELLLRISAVLKRVYAPQGTDKGIAFYLGRKRVDLEKAVVVQDKEEIPLTAKEYGIIKKLYENKGRIVTSDTLCQAVWGENYYGYENSLMVHIRRIREKIEDYSSKPQYLITIRGLGYKLLVDEGSKK